MFSGGLDTQLSYVKPVIKQGLSLSTIGVFVTAIVTGLCIMQVTDFNLYESLMIGSIVSSTDAAAVFSILRSRSIALKGNIRPILELESGSNDPMAYVLTISFLTLAINPSEEWYSIIPFFFKQMILGAILGYIFGIVSHYIINKIDLDYEGLYPVLVIALMFFTFSFTDFVSGNGFLAIYIAAIYLGNHELIHKKTILKVYDGLAWLMQIVLFLTLGLLVFPNQIIPFFITGLIISLTLILLARPLAVLLSLSFFKMPMRNKLFISWVGLRGAVPIVFATYPMIAGLERSNDIFHLVFFISVSSLLIQGTTISKIAKWLKVSLPEKVKLLSETDKFILELPKSSLKEFVIFSNDFAHNKRIVDLKLPISSFIVMILRNGQYIRPGGSTLLQSGDKLMILADRPEDFKKVEKILKLGPDTF